MYSHKVLDHFHHPCNVGEIANPTAVIELTNPVCGDVIKLWVTVQAGRIAEVRFKVAGCVPAVACGSWLTEWMFDKSPDELAGLTPEMLETGLDGLPPASHHAAVLATEALRNFLDKLR